MTWANTVSRITGSLVSFWHMMRAYQGEIACWRGPQRGGAVPLPDATGCGICTRLCIIHFFLCGLSALDRAALIGEEICERITNQQTPNFGAGYARTTDGAAVPSG